MMISACSTYFVSLTRLGRMVQSGLVGKWHRDEVTKIKQSASQLKEDRQDGGRMNVEQGSVAGRPLALDHLQVHSS